MKKEKGAGEREQRNERSKSSKRREATERHEELQKQMGNQRRKRQRQPEGKGTTWFRIAVPEQRQLMGFEDQQQLVEFEGSRKEKKKQRSEKWQQERLERKRATTMEKTGLERPAEQVEQHTTFEQSLLAGATSEDVAFPLSLDKWGERGGIYDAFNKKIINDVQLPWPFIWATSRHHPKYIMLRRPPPTDLDLVPWLSNFENRLKWRWVFEGTMRRREAGS